MSKGQIQMVVYSSLVALLSIGAITYIVIKHPRYLHADRDGVPYFTPQVIDPVTNKPVDMRTLIRNFKGETP